MTAERPARRGRRRPGAGRATATGEWSGSCIGRHARARPALLGGRERGLLARHDLRDDRIENGRVDPREGISRASPGFLRRVLRHERREESLLDARVRHNADAAKYHNGAKGYRGVTFHGSVRKHLTRLVHLEAHAIAELDVGEKVSTLTCGVQKDPLLHPYEQVRHDIGVTVGAQSRGSPAMRAREKLLHLLAAHELVGAPQIASAWHIIRNVIQHRSSSSLVPVPTPVAPALRKIANVTPTQASRRTSRAALSNRRPRNAA